MGIFRSGKKNGKRKPMPKVLLLTGSPACEEQTEQICVCSHAACAMGQSSGHINN